MSREAPLLSLMQRPAGIPEARTREQLIGAHRELHERLAVALEALEPAVFFAPQGSFWSPAQHLDHLVRSVRPLAKALGYPRWLLRLLFGGGKRSRPPAEVVDLYLARLAAGGKAGGAYLPAAAGAPDRAAQQALVARWRRTGLYLDQALAGWSEADLDRYRLPHPLIGKLTVREMVAWSLYHGDHHLARIAERS